MSENETPKVVIPAGVKKPQDHKKPAAQIEAEGAPTIDITWQGHTFTIDADTDNWLVEVTQAYEDGKGASMIRGVLGPKQYAEFMATRPRNKQLNELGEIIAKALGLTSAGE